LIPSTSNHRSVEGKERRQRLFKKSRPLVRPYEQKDNGFLWAAYQRGAFDIPRGLDQNEFLISVGKQFGQFPLIWIVEDDSTQFKSGRGQVALVAIKSDGWVFEPTPLFFPWARHRNVLRACVAFFQMMRYQKDVGCCLVRSGKEHSQFLIHMQKFGVLFPRARIPFGSSNGDVWIFSINGKKTNGN
jgi:hypothetical protein